jgi:hypothetical protein
VHVADPVRAQPPVARGGPGRDERRTWILASGGGFGLGPGSGAGAGLGVAATAQVVVDGVEDARVDGVQALAAQRWLDLLGDQAAVVLQRVRRDRLVARSAPLDPQVDRLAKGLQAGAGVLPVGDLGAQARLDLLSLAVAAVDLARELPLFAGERVQAGVDDHLPAMGACVDGQLLRSVASTRRGSLTSR